MLGSLVLIAIPLVLMATGALCSARDYRLVFSIITGAAVFAVCGICAFGGSLGAEEQAYAAITASAGYIPFDDLTLIGAPPAVTLIIKICAAFSQEPYFFPLVMAVIQSLLAAAAVFYRCETPYAAGAVIAACFIPAYFAGSGTFTAALIGVFASKYIEEKRFFRFAAVMMFAACFDTAAIIPVFFCILLFSENVYISALRSFVFAACAILFTGITDSVCNMLGDGRYAVCGISPVCAAAAVLAGGIAAAMKPMLVNRSKRNDVLISETVCGALFAVAAVFDGRLFGLAAIMLMQSVIPVVPDAFAVGQKFTVLMFPEKKKTASRNFVMICAAVLAVICVCFVFFGGFGAERYDTALKAVISV